MMKRLAFLFFILALGFEGEMNTFAQSRKQKSPKIKYKYKKYEKFDFERFSVEGDDTDPGDVSINPRFNVKFINNLPSKPSFNKEVLDSVDSIP